MFGELSLFDPGPRTSTATAVTDAKLLSLSHEKLIPWLKGNPEVSLHLLARLAQRRRRTNEAVGDLVFSDVPGRVAKALIDLGDRFGKKTDEGLFVQQHYFPRKRPQQYQRFLRTLHKQLLSWRLPLQQTRTAVLSQCQHPTPYLQRSRHAARLEKKPDF